MCLDQEYPGRHVSMRWYPGHVGITGNENVDKLAKATAKKSLSDTIPRPPGLAAFQSAIKEWVGENTAEFVNEQSKRLEHEQQPERMFPEYSTSAITQLRSGHSPLNNYLFRHQQQHDPACEFDTGIETIDNHLFIYPRFTQQWKTLLTNLKRLKFTPSKVIFPDPKVYDAVEDYYVTTWLLKDFWEWAKVVEEPLFNILSPPTDWRASPHRWKPPNHRIGLLITSCTILARHPFPPQPRGFTGAARNHLVEVFDSFRAQWILKTMKDKYKKRFFQRGLSTLQSNFKQLFSHVIVPNPSEDYIKCDEL